MLYDAAVIGTGPAGSAITAKLAGNGLGVCLFERGESADKTTYVRRA